MPKISHAAKIIAKDLKVESDNSVVVEGAVQAGSGERDPSAGEPVDEEEHADLQDEDLDELGHNLLQKLHHIHMR